MSLRLSIGQRNDEVSEALLEVDAAVEVLEPGDEDQLVEERKRYKRRASDRQELVERVAARRKVVTPLVQPAVQGGRGRGGGQGRRGRGRVSGGQLAPKLPSTIDRQVVRTTRRDSVARTHPRGVVRPLARVRVLPGSC